MAKIDWEKHIEAWQRGGLSQAAYCRRQGLSAGLFRSGCERNVCGGPGLLDRTSPKLSGLQRFKLPAE
jgi:hypothetical protein